MNIHIVCVGKLKEKYWQEAMREYSKRLSGYCRFAVTEVKDIKTPEKLSAEEEKIIKRTEGLSIMANIKKAGYLIVLDIKGRQMTSEDLAYKMQALAIEGKSNITFIIGGSIGLCEDLLAKADYRLSFSPMTFPHQMMRIILAEQIYRGFKIINRETYHK